ncbi:hypothetical protein CXF83_02055 [Shewanella sp. Choline-02u-19]|uniref:hypothetical protein n=1 Tax=unclassified Shewanella TaxID=196818 RepID=UPI000C3412B5|nr:MULTISPECIES: hypothetical protein [unclassified Shewanella]PKH58273.1 hypothetical protein CXF84_06480 [Shewanella sp. Bg11-22]PKI29463.1 hypothetical protein CXF83_02055 [Shewanella sp. Choline-02u-19]
MRQVSLWTYAFSDVYLHELSAPPASTIQFLPKIFILNIDVSFLLFLMVIFDNVNEMFLFNTLIIKRIYRQLDNSKAIGT